MTKKLVFSFLTLLSVFTYAQVKIGNNPGVIDSNSLLELESTNKFLVITRMSGTQMTSLTPLEGAMVYNTDQRCVYVYRKNTANVLVWESLCSSATTNDSFIKSTTSPASPTKGDIWINGNVTSGWDGTNWIVLSRSIINGNGVPDGTTAPNPKAGDLYVNNTTGDIYTYNGSTWVNKSKIKAINGLTVNASNEVVLGGKLTTNTEIDTDSKELKIKGLPVITTPTADDNIVTVDKTTGQFKQTSSVATMLRQKEETLTASDGQIIFPGLTLLTTDKINVYRNGVRVDFTIDSSTQITLEPAAECYAGDKIKIVQLY